MRSLLITSAQVKVHPLAGLSLKFQSDLCENFRFTDNLSGKNPLNSQVAPYSKWPYASHFGFHCNNTVLMGIF